MVCVAASGQYTYLIIVRRVPLIFINGRVAVVHALPVLGTLAIGRRSDLLRLDGCGTRGQSCGLGLDATAHLRLDATAHLRLDAGIELHVVALCHACRQSRCAKDNCRLLDTKHSIHYIIAARTIQCCVVGASCSTMDYSKQQSER